VRQLRSAKHGQRHRLVAARWFALLGLILALVPAWAPAVHAADQATINITAVADDGTTPLPFARFQVIDSDGTLITTRETTPPDGTVSIDIDLTDPSLTYTVTMETPPACANKPDDRDVGPFAAGDSVDLTFETSFDDGCTLGGISFYAYTCPSGLDLTVEDYAQYRDNCLQADNGETFTLTEQDNQRQTFQLTTGEYGIDGRAPIVGLVPGEFSASQDGADPGTTLVYCLTFDGTPAEAPTPSDTSREKVNKDGEITLTLKDRNRIACDFFAVSEALPGADSGNNGDSSDNAGQPSENSNENQGQVVEGNQNSPQGVAGSASIEFHVATCEAGYSGSDFFTDCGGNGTDNVTFTVLGQNTATTDSATSNVPATPGFGIAVIDNLPADTYTMSEDVPGDFVSTWVYCADSPGGGQRIPTPENGTQQYDIDLANGQAVICDWFIIPDQQQVEPGILRLTKFTCAPGYGGRTFGELTADCTDATDGVAFNLSNGSGYSNDETTHNVGRIRFTDLVPGNGYVLTEDLPGDALDYRAAFCAPNGGDYIEYRVRDNGSIPLDPIAAGDQVQCLWFNVPTNQNVGTGSVEIHKSECPAGTNSDFFATCHDNPVGGIGFDLTGPGSYANSGTTGDNGKVIFTDLPTGKFTISEIAPAGYSVALYAVHCTRDGAAFPTTYDDATGLRINFTLPAGANIICDWYNVPKGAAPTPTPSGGTITVIKRLCTEDPKDIKNFRDECALYGAGAGFELKSVSTGATQTGTTGNNSQVAFSGLANGAYGLKETTGDWCKAEADHVDASGNVLVVNGGNTNVYIYNCGPKGVHTLPSTGTGGTGSSLPLTGWAMALLAVALLAGGVTLKPVVARRAR
jgi:hypothetical protein